MPSLSRIKTPAKKELGTDAAKRAMLLLNTISVVKDVAGALSDFKSTYLEDEESKYLRKKLPKKAMLEVDNIIHALDYIYNKCRRQTARICSVPYLLPSYDKRKRLDREIEGTTQKYYRKHRTESSYRVNEFVKQSGDCMSRRGKKRDKPHDGFAAETPEQKNATIQ